MDASVGPRRQLFSGPLSPHSPPHAQMERMSVGEYYGSPEHYKEAVAVAYESQEKMRELRMDQESNLKQRWDHAIHRAEGRLSPDLSVGGFISKHRSALSDKHTHTGIHHHLSRPFAPSPLSPPVYMSPAKVSRSSPFAPLCGPER